VPAASQWAAIVAEAEGLADGASDGVAAGVSVEVVVGDGDVGPSGAMETDDALQPVTRRIAPSRAEIRRWSVPRIGCSLRDASVEGSVRGSTGPARMVVLEHQ